MVLLIGNYAPDRQQSMDRFAMMLLDGLTAAGVQAQLIRAGAIFWTIPIGRGLRRKVAGLPR